jgi:phosphoribosylamine---glycine ligase
MKVGLIGNGGREHAIARGVCQHGDVDLYVAATGENPGIRELASDYHMIALNDLQNVREYFLANKVDVVVVGPEAPLISGVVDAIRDSKVPIVGPTQSQARLEGDKSFMRWLLREKVGWGSPKWQKVKTLSEAQEFIEEIGAIVVKPLGLTGGKGVRVSGTQLDDTAETLAYIETLLETDGTVLLEEKVIGEEFSRMAFVSDGVVAPVPLMQDFKYAYDGDTGLMTGGMGAYSMADGGLPFLMPSDYDQADRLLKETVLALEIETGEPYRGFLYGQFMAACEGIRVIEYNVRLGDPEALNLMAILGSAAAPLLLSIAVGKLDREQVSFKGQASVSKYLVPRVYPDPISAPIEFSFDTDLVDEFGLSLICGSVERKAPNEWLALGSRTLGIVGLGDTPEEVSKRIEAFIEKAAIPQLRHRQDIGNKDIILNKIAKMDEIRHGL